MAKIGTSTEQTRRREPPGRRAGAARLLSVLVPLATLGACGDDPLPEELVAPTASALTERASSVDLVLAPADAECAARNLDEQQASAIVADTDAPVAGALADAVIDCVGEDVIARTALAPFTAGAADASLACAGKRLDDELIRELLAARLSGRPAPRAEIELAVVAAVSLCLEPDELRGRG